MPKRVKQVKGITKNGLKGLVSHWEKFAKCYFWSPPGSASGRRSEEKRHYRETEFSVDASTVHVKIEVSCSCRNYYCTKQVRVDGERKTLAYLKGLINKADFADE